MVQLGASLKQGGANCVFEIVAKLREYQRLKEEGLRLRRQAVIKEYRTQVAMAWLKCSMGGSDAKKTKSLKKERRRLTSAPSRWCAPDADCMPCSVFALPPPCHPLLFPAGHTGSESDRSNSSLWI